jgi:hypothetical protein
LLLDQFLPRWDFAERHQTLVAAPAERVFLAVWELDLSRSPLTGALMRLRELPWRLRRRSPRLPLNANSLDKLLAAGFILLGREEPRELVLGLVGRPWRLSPEIIRLKPREFADFCQPGQVKVAMNLMVEPLAAGGCRLSSETRVQGTSPGARRRFLPYWILIRPFSGLIRREMLLAIRRGAQAQKK